MEERKQKEIEYYDKQAEDWKKTAAAQKWQTDFEGFNPLILESFRYCYKLLAKNCKGKKVLDYGCGNGVHSSFLAKNGADVIGIDLSEPLLQIAREKIEREGLEGKVKFLNMDCEKTDFPDNSFDLIFDGGTFSSLDLQKVLPELSRILKSGGIVIGIETFGHNPFTNLKRRINKMSGKRTGWAANHIFNMEGLKLALNYFGKVEADFFHLVSWTAFPFLSLPGGKILLRIMEVFDKLFLTIPFLRKYSFKAVFVFRDPKKHV